MLRVKGRLRHCWWGTYHATIGLFCNSSDEALHVQEFLGEPWSIHEQNDSVVVYHGKDPELKVVLNQLEDLGANRKKITSIAKSIDLGEEFNITVK